MKLNELTDIIKSSNFDAVLLTGLENQKAGNNLRYITGYIGSFGLAVIGEGYQYFISDFRYREQVIAQVPDFTFVELEGTIAETLTTILKKENIKCLVCIN